MYNVTAILCTFFYLIIVSIIVSRGASHFHWHSTPDWPDIGLYNECLCTCPRQVCVLASLAGNQSYIILPVLPRQQESPWILKMILKLSFYHFYLSVWLLSVWLLFCRIFKRNLKTKIGLSQFRVAFLVLLFQSDRATFGSTVKCCLGEDTEGGLWSGFSPPSVAWRKWLHRHKLKLRGQLFECK